MCHKEEPPFLQSNVFYVFLNSFFKEFVWVMISRACSWVIESWAITLLRDAVKRQGRRGPV